MDHEQFAARVMQKSGMLYRVAKTLLRDEEDCRDALGDMALKAWAGRHSLREDAFFDTWLTRILINECYTILRRRKKRKEQSLPMCKEAEQDESDVLDALHTLPERLRLPITLHYVEGYSVAQTARILRVPQSTVRGRLARGRQALRLEMEADRQEANGQ